MIFFIAVADTWQINKTFIIVIICSFLPGYAQFGVIFRGVIKMLFACQLSNLLHYLASYDYLLVVEMVVKEEGILLRVIVHNLHTLRAYSQHSSQNALNYH